METATKPQLSVINGGGAKVSLKAERLKMRLKPEKVMLSFGLDGKQLEFEIEPPKFRLAKGKGLFKPVARLTPTRFWEVQFLDALIENTSSPYDPLGIPHDYVLQINALYRGGINPEEACRIILRYHYSDYPFPSRSIKAAV